jgi:membrane protein YdbS with pleckstrin-like domain
MSEARALLEGETLLWQGRPTWRAWAGTTILGWVLAPVVVGIVILVMLGVRKRSVSWMITNRRIETDVGWMSHQIDTLELWRVKDIEFRQGFWDRVFGVATVLITSQDEKEPLLEIRGLPGGRAVYDQLSNAVMTARQQRGVLNLNQ